MRDTSSPAKGAPKPTFRHGPRTGKALAVVALGGLPLWFALKFALPSESGVVEVVSALAALAGVVCGIVLFVGTYGFWANAPAAMLDERQAAERDQAYIQSFRVLALVLLAGWFGAEMTDLASAQVLRNLLLVLFFLTLILPSAVTALRDVTLDDAD